MNAHEPMVDFRPPYKLWHQAQVQFAFMHVDEACDELIVILSARSDYFKANQEKRYAIMKPVDLYTVNTVYIVYIEHKTVFFLLYNVGCFYLIFKTTVIVIT